MRIYRASRTTPVALGVTVAVTFLVLAGCCRCANVGDSVKMLPKRTRNVVWIDAESLTGDKLFPSTSETLLGQEGLYGRRIADDYGIEPEQVTNAAVGFNIDVTGGGPRDLAVVVSGSFESKAVVSRLESRCHKLPEKEEGVDVWKGVDWGFFAVPKTGVLLLAENERILREMVRIAAGKVGGFDTSEEYAVLKKSRGGAVIAGVHKVNRFVAATTAARISEDIAGRLKINKDKDQQFLSRQLNEQLRTLVGTSVLSYSVKAGGGLEVEIESVFRDAEDADEFEDVVDGLLDSLDDISDLLAPVYGPDDPRTAIGEEVLQNIDAEEVVRDGNKVKVEFRIEKNAVRQVDDIITEFVEGMIPVRT